MTAWWGHENAAELRPREPEHVSSALIVPPTAQRLLCSCQDIGHGKLLQPAGTCVGQFHVRDVMRGQGVKLQFQVMSISRPIAAVQYLKRNRPFLPSPCPRSFPIKEPGRPGTTTCLLCQRPVAQFLPRQLSFQKVYPCFTNVTIDSSSSSLS